MPLPEHRVLERNRNQDNGEPSAQPIGVELQPAIRADLLDPALWQDGLAKVRPWHEPRGGRRRCGRSPDRVEVCPFSLARAQAL
jgi:hypothetical protein